jgi:hypothetical protein
MTPFEILSKCFRLVKFFGAVFVLLKDASPEDYAVMR